MDNSPFNVRLGLTKRECIDMVKKLYSSGLSQKEIAKKLGVNKTTIENYFKINKLKSRKFFDRPLAIKHCNLSTEDLEVINGLMLGDGCLSKTSKLSARLTFSGKNLHIIKNYFTNLKFSYWSGSLLIKPPGSKQAKLYKSNRLKSHSYKELLDIRNKWYTHRKIIPDDLILTPIVCYWWYIGDGCFNKPNKRIINSCKISLCTECFSKNENEKLVIKLKNLGLNAIINNRNRIIFCKTKKSGDIVKFSNKTMKHYDYAEEGIKFLNYIKNNVNINKEYEYKFTPVL